MSWVQAFRDCPHFSGSLLFDESLAKHTFFKIGSTASLVAIPKTEADLFFLSERIRADAIPFFILGLGSNLLAPDTHSSRLYIKTTQLNQDLLEEASFIRAGASVTVASFLRKAAVEGWGGFEFMSGIPGTIGGLVAMNGGTHLGEVADHLYEVKTFSFLLGKTSVFSKERLLFTYRKNLFLPEGDLITEASWFFQPGDPKNIREKLDTLYRRRKETQPLDFPSCGSVFKNPEGTSLRAWEVVEKLGLRGYRIGRAQISEQHPNWILNLGGARAADVMALINLVKTRAQNELSIELHEEVRILTP